MRTGRPTQTKANAKAIQQMIDTSDQVLDLRPVIGLTMRYCGCTLNEIAKVFNITRQMAETIVKNAERDIHGKRIKGSEAS